MSHACPEFGQQCYCDLEDYDSELPDDCGHDCDLDDGEDVLFSGEVAISKQQTEVADGPRATCETCKGDGRILMFWDRHGGPPGNGYVNCPTRGSGSGRKADAV